MCRPIKCVTRCSITFVCMTATSNIKIMTYTLDTLNKSVLNKKI